MLNQTNNSVQTNETSVNLFSGDATTQMKEKIVELEHLLKQFQVSCGMCIKAGMEHIPMQNGRTLSCPRCHSDYQPNGHQN